MKKINNKGFTLVEVLAVIVIIAVVGMIAIPNVLTSINKGKESSFDILVDDIKIAGQQMFEELDNIGSTLYKYDTSGKKEGDFIKINRIETGDDENTTKTQIVVNLQTLVSNGFLVGTNREEGNATNANSKVILSPIDSEDLGECEISITKVVNKSDNYKTNYYFTFFKNKEVCSSLTDYNS